MSESEQPGGPVLVVTQRRDRHAAVAEALGRRGLRVDAAAPDALPEGAALDRYALAFVDIECPHEAVRGLTARVRRVVVVGNRDDSGEVLRALRLGAQDFLDARLDPADVDAVLSDSKEEPAPGAFIEYVDRFGDERRL